MDRRESIKSLLIGSMAGGLLIEGCDTKEEVAAQIDQPNEPKYGRTPEEKIRDEKIKSEEFLTPYELGTIAILCDLILPSTEEVGSASDAGVPEFVEFIVKDIPTHQLKIRGGLMWLDNRSNALFNLTFDKLNLDQQKSILDEIAYPDKATPEVSQGVEFFSHLRNLTLTGYYTSEIGIKELGYKGNTPNLWDGVPQEVLDEHGMSYDEDWLAKCLDPNTRNDVAQWDDEGNLIS